MHEHSLVRALFREVEKLVYSAGDVNVTEVRVQVGPLAGVEPLLLASAFSQLAPQSSMPEAELVIEEVALTAKCLDCGQKCEIHDFRFQCPHCQSKRLQVTAGDCMLLRDVTFESLGSPAGVAP